MKPALLPLPLAALAVLLSACQQGAAPTPAAESSTAAPDAKPGLALADGRLVLPAVKGNPAAAYFRLSNTSAEPAVIAAVDVAGAGMAMMHQTATNGGRSSMDMMENPAVKPGATIEFAPGGKHVMITDIPEDWAPGATVEMTLIFSDGDKLSAPLKVLAAGDAR